MGLRNAATDTNREGNAGTFTIAAKDTDAAWALAVLALCAQVNVTWWYYDKDHTSIFWIAFGLLNLTFLILGVMPFRSTFHWTFLNLIRLIQSARFLRNGVPPVIERWACDRASAERPIWAGNTIQPQTLPGYRGDVLRTGSLEQGVIGNAFDIRKRMDDGQFEVRIALHDRLRKQLLQSQNSADFIQIDFPQSLAKLWHEARFEQS